MARNIHKKENISRAYNQQIANIFPHDPFAAFSEWTSEADEKAYGGL
jgi:hypothetical protein